MFKIQNREMADMFNLPVGYVLGKAEEARIRPVWEQHLSERDEARYRKALASAHDHAYVVTKTWQHNGESLRRGEVVWMKPYPFSVMITTTRGSAQGFVWKCGKDELDAHATKAWRLRKEQM